MTAGEAGSARATVASLLIEGIVGDAVELVVDTVEMEPKYI